ncbi:6-phosphogluconolactonase [Opitutaceae bacterium TAV4]|nr:6-phosphogluconolactonase [Opitutaceae bacterium TAV4]RRK01228.1 6-phosphogluconolactonase [Opitutaceae bacterium TAV3]
MTTTPYGRLLVADKDTLFRTALFLALEQHARIPAGARFLWALTGGGTPGEWYRWAVSTGALPTATAAAIDWTVSDERYVPLASPESNFGNAARDLLDPLGVPASRRHPWPVDLPPADAANAYARDHAATFGERAYNVCFLGMGDDCHTASLFPGTPLLANDGGALFGAQEVPGKGWRLTITPTGLAACDLIVIMTLGAGKAGALHRVMRGPCAPNEAPSQILKNTAAKTVWLVDPTAAGKL